MNSAKIRDFRSKLTPGVIQTKKRHKTIRNGDHDLITNSIFMKLMFNYKMLSCRCCVSPLNCGYFNRKRGW